MKKKMKKKTRKKDPKKDTKKRRGKKARKKKTIATFRANSFQLLYSMIWFLMCYFELFITAFFLRTVRNHYIIKNIELIILSNQWTPLDDNFCRLVHLLPGLICMAVGKKQFQFSLDKEWFISPTKLTCLNQFPAFFMAKKRRRAETSLHKVVELEFC